MLVQNQRPVPSFAQPVLRELAFRRTLRLIVRFMVNTAAPKKCTSLRQGFGDN